VPFIGLLRTTDIEIETQVETKTKQQTMDTLSQESRTQSEEWLPLRMLIEK